MKHLQQICMESAQPEAAPRERPHRYHVSLPRGIGEEIRLRARKQGTMPAFYIEQVMRAHLDRMDRAGAPVQQSPVIA